MAGEAHIIYGLGYRFSGGPFRDEHGYFEGFEYESYFDPEFLYSIDPFHGVENPDFAVIARSTMRSGDPADWGSSRTRTDYGLQNLNLEPTEAEQEAFGRLFAGLNTQHPEKIADGASDLELILSITADI